MMMKAFRLLFVLTLLMMVPVLAGARAKTTTTEHTIYKADLSGSREPGVSTMATGEAVFLPVGPVMGATGAGAGGQAEGTTPKVETMSGFGTSVPGDDTGMAGPGQGFDQGGFGTPYEGFVGSPDNTGSAAVGTKLGYWGMPDVGSRTRYEGSSGATVGKAGEVEGAGAGGSAKGAIAPEELGYTLTASDIHDVTGAHIHMGKPGSNGPVVAPLNVAPQQTGTFNGVLAQGTITNSDLTGPLAGKTVGDLVNLIKSGDAYVNVHTAAHPSGEITGQVMRLSCR